MGLDWHPGGKAKPGYEAEFLTLWHKLHARTCFFRERKISRFKEITITPYETLGAPRVGFDPEATEWARREAFPRRVDKTIGEEAFVNAMRGYYVLDLLAPC